MSGVRGEYRFHVGAVPVLKVHHEPRPRAAVLVLHGLGASAETQRKELQALADAGLTAVGVDAPHHGRRRDDAWFDVLEHASPLEMHARILEHVEAAAAELPRVLDHLHSEGHGPFGVLGISLGAYTALALAADDARLRATVSLLGSPDWSARSDPKHHHPRMDRAPMHRPAALLRHPVLFINAGRDVNVPARFSRAFVKRVNHPNAHHVEYPHSDHFMRPQDWEDAWARSVDFLRHHLQG